MRISIIKTFHHNVTTESTCCKAQAPCLAHAHTSVVHADLREASRLITGSYLADNCPPPTPAGGTAFDVQLRAASLFFNITIFSNVLAQITEKITP